MTKAKFTKKFLYFVYNYPQDWIEQIWGEDTHIAKHFREKFHYLCNDKRSSHGFIDFCMELSDHYFGDLIEYVDKHYKG